MRRCIARAAGLLVLPALLTACAATKITSSAVPESGSASAAFLCGRLDYEASNTEWLPRALRDVRSDPHRTLRYRYEILYGIDDESAFDLFNPLLMVGATKSKDSLYILGLLEIDVDGKRLRDFREVVTVEKSKSVFSEGETLTEMRRQGLLRLRALMDARLAAENTALQDAGLGCDSDLSPSDRS